MHLGFNNFHIMVDLKEGSAKEGCLFHQHRMRNGSKILNFSILQGRKILTLNQKGSN